MASSSKILPFASSPATPWIEEYQQTSLTEKDSGTRRVYVQILREFTQWVIKRSGKEKRFQPEQITSLLVEQYLQELITLQYSVSHCQRVKSVIHQFCQWLIEEKGRLQQNPTRSLLIERPASPVPRQLTPAQRFILQALVKQDDRRGKALFALGYWAGCRVTDIVELQLAHAHIGAKQGWLHLESEGEKARDIDLPNEARRPFYDYLQHRGREEGSPYVFLSQRGSHLTDAGLHHWFRALKQQATPEDWKLITDIHFHDLRHDFVHRALEADWTIEEIAYYLGHLTVKGTPAVQTTMRYNQITRAQVKEKLKKLNG